MSLLGSTRIRLTSALALAVALGLTACSQVNNGVDAHVSSPQPGALPTCPTVIGSTTLPPGRDYTAVVPARFGWLPLALMGHGSVDLLQGPSNGGSYPVDYVANAEGVEPTSVVSGAGFGVTVRPDTAGVPGQRPPRACRQGRNVMSSAGVPTASAVTPDVQKKPAPPVHGSPAYFMAEPASGDGGPGETLTWKAASGNWLTVSLQESGGTAGGWDSSTGEAALEHMARTLRVGAVPLPLPVQFTGIPAAWRMRVGQIELTQDLSVQPPAFVRLDAMVYFGAGPAAWAHLTVLPANPLSHGVVPIPTASTMCKNGPGLTACIDIVNMSEVQGFIPVSSPARSIMGHLAVLGADPVAWTPNMVAGTVQGGHRSSPVTPPAPVTVTVHPEPVDLVISGVTHGGHVELRWVPQGGDTGVAGYEIYRTGLNPPAAEALIATVGPSQDSYVDTTALKVPSRGVGLYSYLVITQMEDGSSISSGSVVAQLSQPAHA